MITKKEKIILNKLAEAWNEFLKLDIQNSDDITEFRYVIHFAQNIIMKRETVRNNKKIFHNISKKGSTNDS